VLKKITLLRERVENWDEYPFCVPAIRTFQEMQLESKVCFFVGENGSGKSTLLEAIAAHYGFGREGGTRSFANDSTESSHSVDPLVKAMRLSFDVRTGAGFFLRAESLFNVVSYIDQLGINDHYDGESLHASSHGETFLKLLKLKFQRNGLFLLDEPEAALSPQRQLAFLVLIHDTVRRYRNAQFVIASHSPVSLGYPEAQIISFDGERLRTIDYEQTASLQIVRHFLNHREGFLEELFRETPSLFEQTDARAPRRKRAAKTRPSRPGSDAKNPTND